jgi:hypothetical protein
VVTIDVVDAEGSLDDADADDAPGLLSDEHASSAIAARTSARRRITRWWHGYGHPVPSRSATCVWRATPALIIALDERFGEPTDAYVNGSQTWLRDDGPGGVALEWRLHPVAAYQRPDDLDTYEVFSAVALALGTGGELPAAVEALWDGLEAFPAYDDEIEPAPLSAAVEESLGIEPDAVGLVDHAAIGDRWERSHGKVSIIDELMAELRA